MIRRPLNERFTNKVLDGIKITTIRENPWPVGKPIMLYRWTGKPYRSKTAEICPIVVEATAPIEIHLPDFSDIVRFKTSIELPRELWDCEGFNGPLDMNDWFGSKMKADETQRKHLMKFRRAYPDEVKGGHNV